MQLIPLSASPNQELSVILDNNQWNIAVRDVNGSVAVSLTRNNEIIVQNARAVTGMRILQARYQEAGNFAIIGNNQGIVDYTQFGVTQFLVYISQAEIDALAPTPQDRITASYFDTLGGLPLRFAPQGYTMTGVIRGRSVKFRAKATLAAVKA